MAKPIVEMVIESAILELPDTKTIKLQWPAGYNVEFKTGQFITLFWPDEPQYKRAYSLSSCALDRGFFEVTVKREGKMGTRIVDWAQPGHKVGVLPPTGRFLPVFEPGKHLLCLAGGAGVTPFRGFVREATRRGVDTKITVLHSVRTTSDIIFQDQFKSFQGENPHFEWHITCTRLMAEDPWAGRRGRLDADCIRQYVRDLPNTIFYACGPTSFVEAAEGLVLRELGASKEQMKTEKWG
jgi:glycine betaine catabolism B